MMRTQDGHGGSGHHKFLWLLVGTYVLATVLPEAGQWISSQTLISQFFGYHVRASAPAAMLGVLLFAAGLAVRGEHLRGIFRRPTALAIGLVASVTLPVIAVCVATPILTFWHDPAEVRDLIVGLAMVAAMPVAGSSAGWARAADGDCALSLGLVLLSTLLSPLTTPLAFGITGQLAAGEARDMLGLLAGASGAGTFVVLWVVLPMTLGLLARWLIGGKRADAASPRVKSITSVILLILCYANASACLPKAITNPDWDFLALVVGAAGLMCGFAFTVGFAAARVARADRARRAALVFGIGMANNGAGLSLAAGVLSACPMALLPVVAVNLVQHLAAGYADARLRRETGV